MSAFFSFKDNYPEFVGKYCGIKSNLFASKSSDNLFIFSKDAIIELKNIFDVFENNKGRNVSIDPKEY
jgi:hypothetical protein